MANNEPAKALDPQDYINVKFNHQKLELTSLHRRLLAPNHWIEAEWIEENRSHFDDSGVNWDQTCQSWQLEGAGISLPTTLFQSHHQLHAVYKTHQNIVTKCKANLEDSRSLNALLSHIVWQCAAPNGSAETRYTQTLAIRRAFNWLIDDGSVPSISEWQLSNQWLKNAIAAVVKTFSKEHPRYTDLQLLQNIMEKKARYGETRNECSPSDDDSTTNDIDSQSHLAYTPNYYLDLRTGTMLSERIQLNPLPDGTEALDADESSQGKPIEVTLGPSALSEQDKNFACKHVVDAKNLSQVQGVFHKATDSPDIAALKLSNFDPASPEGQTMVLMITLGRISLVSDLCVGSSSNLLVIPSIQDETLNVELSLPSHWDIELLVEDHKKIGDRISRVTKKSGHLGSWAHSLQGLGRFGAYHFHGKLGAVVAAQLQGNNTAVRVTAGYTALTAEDFQKGFNTILLDVLLWIAEDAKYVDARWKEWALSESNKVVSSSTHETLYGSKRVLLVNNEAQQSMERDLRDKYQLAESRRARTPTIEYFDSCGLALHTAFQLATGARPVSAITKLSIAGDCATLSDKSFGRFHPERMIQLHSDLSKALLRHKNNVISFANRSNNDTQITSTTIKHPFITARRNAEGRTEVVAITQKDISQWLSKHTGSSHAKANGIRHAFISGFQKIEYYDGKLIQLVGHERRGASITSTYLSVPAIATTDLASAIWIPPIKDVRHGN